MYTLYKVVFGKIVPVEVERETECFIVRGLFREAKKTGWYQYFSTEKEALLHLIKKEQDNVLTCEKIMRDTEEIHEGHKKKLEALSVEFLEKFEDS